MGRVLDQFANTDNPLGHYTGTGPELWEQTDGRITHFVSSMGTTGERSCHCWHGEQSWSTTSASLLYRCQK